MDCARKRPARLRLARAFAAEATRLYAGPLPGWCLISPDEIARYHHEAASALLRCERVLRHGGQISTEGEPEL